MCSKYILNLRLASEKNLPYQCVIDKSMLQVLQVKEAGYCMIEKWIVYGTRVLYDYTRLSLGLASISLNVQRTWKLSIRDENNVVLNENSVEGKPCINRESKSDELTI